MQPDLSTLPGKGSTVVACAECQRPMRIFPSTLTYRPHPTCSHACKSARHSRIAVEKNSRPCVVCGKPFYDTPGAFAKENRKACSLECRAVWQTGRKLAAPDSLARRFAEKRVKQDGCWGWLGSTSDGYGVIGGPGQRNLYAHRLAWEEATGDTLTSLDFIGHVCDNPPCSRNDDEGTYEVKGVVLPRRGHLFKGTSADNSKDMWAKGRARPTHLRGEQAPRAKLTEASVLLIRAALLAGAHPKELAAQYGVTGPLIRAIGKRAIWKHLP